MNYGWQREKLKNTPLVGNPVPEHQRFEKFRSFTPQKTIAVKRAKKVILGAVVALSAMLVAGIAYLLR
jgi:hypothetical protein